MPKVYYQGQVITCEQGTRLRDALLAAGSSPHQGRATLLNCRGLGSCGTCALKIVEGQVGPLTKMERWRLNFPPHKLERGLRLACQVRVEHDLRVEKLAGFWGQGSAEDDGE